MSGYQYYEFAAIDRPLTEKEMDELRGLSSRAQITPTSFINEYSFGDFRSNPRKILEKYFDAFLYLANWGTHRLMFRLPARLFDAKRAGKYCDGENLSLHRAGKHVALEFVFQEEGGGWIEGEGWLQKLLPLREELLAGDLRCLYLGWLGAATTSDDEDGVVEPPLPRGLGKLSSALREFAEFISLDDDIIAAAAEGDDRPPPEPPSQQELADWIAEAPSAEKDAWLRAKGGKCARKFSRNFAKLRRRKRRKGMSSRRSARGRCNNCSRRESGSTLSGLPKNKSAPHGNRLAASARPPRRASNASPCYLNARRRRGRMSMRSSRAGSPPSTIGLWSCSATCARWRSETGESTRPTPRSTIIAVVIPAGRRSCAG